MIGSLGYPVHIKHKTLPTNRVDLWCIHGLCETSDCFQDIFETDLPEEFNIYLPDMPGFGKSAYLHEDLSSMEKTSRLLAEIIQHESINHGHEVYLLGHSMGGVIAILTAELLPGKIKSLISLEGTIIHTPERANYHFEEYETPLEFKRFLIENTRHHAKELSKSPEKKHRALGLSFHRFCSRLQETKPSAIHAWCRDTALHTEGKDRKPLSERFLELTCHKVYIHGADSYLTPEIEFAYSQETLAVFSIPDSNHWMMLDNFDGFLEALIQCLMEPDITLPKRLSPVAAF